MNDDLLAVSEIRRANRRAWTFFAILWVTVVVLLGAGLVTLYNTAQQTNRTLACVLSVTPDQRAPDLYEECERRT